MMIDVFAEIIIFYQSKFICIDILLIKDND